MVGPILSQTLPDIFCANEYSPNFLFHNNGDGTFTDVAAQAGELYKDSIWKPDRHIHVCPFQNHGVGFTIGAITAFSLLGRLSTRTWSMAVGICARSATRALVRLGTDVK